MTASCRGSSLTGRHSRCLADVKSTSVRDDWLYRRIGSEQRADGLQPDLGGHPNYPGLLDFEIRPDSKLDSDEFTKPVPILELPPATWQFPLLPSFLCSTTSTWHCS